MELILRERNYKLRKNNTGKRINLKITTTQIKIIGDWMKNSILTKLAAVLIKLLLMNKEESKFR